MKGKIVIIGAGKSMFEKISATNIDFKFIDVNKFDERSIYGNPISFLGESSEVLNLPKKRDFSLNIDFSLNRKESRFFKDLDFRSDTVFLIKSIDPFGVFQLLNKNEKRNFLTVDLGRHYFKNLSLRRKKEILNYKF